MPLSVVLYKVFSKSVEKSYHVTIQMKAFEQYLHVVLAIMQYKVAPTFLSPWMNKPKCMSKWMLDQSNESYLTVLSCGT